jgi:multidrug efflux system outer membrane protein
VQESSALNKATFDAGASSEQDLRTAEAQVQTAKINVLEYQRRVAQTQNALEPLVGQPLPPDLPAPPGHSGSRTHTLKAVDASIGAARTQFFPTITLTGSIGTTSSEFDKLFSAGTGVWSFSPQVTVPKHNETKNFSHF